MPRTRTLLALVLLPLLVFAVACSSGDDDDSSSSGGQTTSGDSTTSGSNDGSSSGGSSSAESTPSDTTSSSGGSNDATAEDVIENCPELVGGFGAFSPAALQGGGDFADNVDAIVQLIQNFAANAPGEIQGDAQIIANAVTNFYGTLDEIGVDFSNPATFAALTAEQQAQLAAASEAFDTAEVEQASNNVQAWINDNCS